MVTVSECLMCDEWRAGYDDEEEYWDYEYGKMMDEQYQQWLAYTEEGQHYQILESLCDSEVVREFGMDLVHWHGEVQY